jgi:hypothetical protein
MQSKLCKQVWHVGKVVMLVRYERQAGGEG